MKTNVKAVGARTHEGGAAVPSQSDLSTLKRLVLANLLWEDTFYVDGKSAAELVKSYAQKVTPTELAQLAVDARSKFNLRHIPLLLVRELARGDHALTGEVLEQVLQRADEPGEFLSLYFADNPEQPIDNQVRKGIKAALRKFSAYDLAKYNRDSAKFKLRDVLRLVHPKPKDEEQSAAFKGILDGTLESPDTWEVALSAGKDKKEAFERLTRENKLGHLALLRNLRKMTEVGVSEELICDALVNHKGKARTLPFRYVSAAKYAPQFERELESGMFESCAALPKLKGHTVLVVDVSGSMLGRVSEKSEVSRLDAAAALAMIVSEIAERISIFTFSYQTKTVPPRKGFALRDAIVKGAGGSTMLGQAIRDARTQHDKADRMIVITDEQSHDTVGMPTGLGYMLNVGTYENGVGFGKWTRISGFSENVIRFIQEMESEG